MQISWIDPDELRALANQLLDPEPEPPHDASFDLRELPEAGLPSAPLIGSDFFEESLPSSPLQEADDEELEEDPLEPATPPAEVEQIRAKLRAIRDRARDAGLLPPPPEPPSQPETSQQAPAPPSKPQTTRFLPLEGTIAERLDAFAHWALEFARAENLIIIDDHGDILWGVPTRDDLVVNAMLLIHTDRENAGPETSQILRTGSIPGKQLSVLRAPTRHGCVNLALLAVHHLPDEDGTLLREALSLAVDEAQA